MPEKPGLPENAVPLSEAVTDCSNWRTTADLRLGSGKVYAFKIPMLDFESIFDEDAESIRAYIGEASNGEKKLFLVGVDASGDDMVDYPNGQFVYDFAVPCPPTCDTSSPLS